MIRFKSGWLVMLPSCMFPPDRMKGVITICEASGQTSKPVRRQERARFQTATTVISSVGRTLLKATAAYAGGECRPREQARAQRWELCLRNFCSAQPHCRPSRWSAKILHSVAAKPPSYKRP